MLAQRRGLQRVRLDGGDRAYVLTELSGPVEVGDQVVINTTAVELGLGTGGWHVVVWNLARDHWSAPGGGHVMKLRYTGAQLDAGAAEEVAPDVPAELQGMPVVVGTLHSQVPGIVAAAKAERPDLRVVYVMTDGAALPLASSDLVAALQEARLIAGTITAGHAFGGTLEAVNVPSALALARHRLQADVAVVAMGPGVVGTGTRLGTTALEAAPALDAAAALGGVPVFCVRWSSADPRARHSGMSHHARTVLELARSCIEVPMPPRLVAELAGAGVRHQVVALDPPDVGELLRAHGLEVTTMGRGPIEEREFFAVCGAVGVHAARRAGK